MEIHQAIEALHKQKVDPLRRGYKFWWGNHDQNRTMFRKTFMAVDSSVKAYQHLPEYEEIIDWMSDSKGKGLFLMGACGRGKSTILTGVLPVLMFQHLGLVLRPTHADDIPNNVNQLARYWSVCIDELGVESMVNDYAGNYEGFNRIINAAESKLRPVFISTNLNEEQLLDRYGERTFDRIIRLCRVVKFKGDSLRC
ncbi:DNA replication protein DnaC [Breznakibacter xylanolyticus]|uniref:DNA replication protein DnaC n=1 Tax=Breznakibacter xylanolyticus TaxID=990 RepID=A0A2W7NIY2_9BACT|nr:hypothetical protein [Breznakibacter xylanolyticus]PZX18087.1 DNA replication protein DnaC [Breznakibacter xylanolyticus]